MIEEDKITEGIPPTPYKSITAFGFPARKPKPKAEPEVVEPEVSITALGIPAAEAREEEVVEEPPPPEPEPEPVVEEEPEPPPPEPPPEPPEGYELLVHAGETYFVENGKYYKQFDGKLVSVMEPSELRTIRLYGIDVEETSPDVTEETIATEGLRPDEILVALKEAGATAATLLEYAKEHPDAVRGAPASQLMKGLSAQFLVGYEELTSEEQFERQIEMGYVPEGSEYIPPEVEGEPWGFYTPEVVAEMALRDEVLAKLEPYKTDEGYELQRAFDEGKGADVYAARALGLFTPEDIVAAQFGSIKARAAARDLAEYEASVAEFEAELKEMPIGFQRAYELDGIRGYNNYVEAYNKSLEITAERRAKALEELEPYVEVITYPWEGQRMPEVRYKILQFIEDAPDKEAAERTLLTAGFTEEQIKAVLMPPEIVAPPSFELPWTPKIEQMTGSLYEQTRTQFEDEPWWIQFKAMRYSGYKDELPLSFSDRLRFGKLISASSDPAIVVPFLEALKPGLSPEDQARLDALVTNTKEVWDSLSYEEKQQVLFDYKPPPSRLAALAEELFGIWPGTLIKPLEPLMDFDSERYLLWQELKDRPKSDPERQAFVKDWQRSGIQAAMVYASIPLLILPVPAALAAIPHMLRTAPAIGAVVHAVSKIPIISRIPRMAVQLINLAVRTTPSVYTAAAITEGSRVGDLERKWETFQKLPEGEKVFWVKQAGYEAWEGLNEAEQAHVLLQYSVPPGVTLSEWQNTMMETADSLHEHVSKGVDWIRERAPAPISELLAFAGGTVVGALVYAPTYTAMIPVLASHLIDEVPEGKADDYAKMVMAGMALFILTELPARFKADPAMTLGWGVGLVIGPGGLIKLAKGLGARIHPKYVPERGMAIEWSIVRTPTTAVTPRLRVEGANIMRKALLELLSGKKRVNFTIGNGRFRVEWKGTAYQQVRPYTLFSGITDITKFDPTNPGKRILWGSPQLARRFAIMSASGVRMTKPGVIEVYLGPTGLKQWSANIMSAATLAEMRRLAMEAYARGVPPGAYPPFKQYHDAIELEMTTMGPYEAVPGYGGTGISANVVMGSYPIHRYTLKGLGLEGYKGLSFKNAMKIRYFAGIAALGDLLKGWTSRMDALKRLVYEKGVIETPELRAYLKNESALGNIAEILHGRSEAVEIKSTPELTADFEKALTEWLRSPDAIKYFKGEKVSLEELLDTLKTDPEGTRIALSGAVDIMTKDALGEYAGLFDEYMPYFEEAAYARSYISVYTKFLAAAIAEGIPRREIEVPERFIPTEAIPERIVPKEEVIPAITEYRPPPVEPEEIIPVEEYEPVPPPRYEPPPPPRYEVPPPRYEVPPPEYEVPPPEYEVPPPPEYEVPPPRYEVVPPPRYEVPPPEYPPPPYEPRVPVPPRVPVVPPIVPPGPPEEVVRIRVPPGSIAWKQGALKGGAVWKYIPPPWDMNKPITLVGKVPSGAIRTELRTPRETIQMVGKPKAVVPESISIDLGVVDIYVTNYGKNIQFRGGGLETDVGKRLPSPTKGMSVPETRAGISRLKFGTSLEQLLIGEYETEALRDFGERALAQHLSRLTPEEIAEGIKDVGLTEPKYEGKGKRRVDINAVRIEEILAHLPDRVGTDVRRLLEEKEYIRVGEGYQYAEAMPKWKRQRALEVKALGEKEMRTRKKKAKGKLLLGKQEQEILPSLKEIRIL